MLLRKKSRLRKVKKVDVGKRMFRHLKDVKKTLTERKKFKNNLINEAETKAKAERKLKIK